MVCRCRKIALFVSLSSVVALIAILFHQPNLQDYPDVGKTTVSKTNFVYTIF